MSTNNPDTRQPASQPQQPPRDLAPTRPTNPVVAPVQPQAQPPSQPGSRPTNIQGGVVLDKKRVLSEYAVPPDLDLCKDYRKATMFGIPRSHDAYLEKEQFSNLPLDNCKLKLTTPSEVYARLGNGYYTYFYFIKLLSLLVFFPFFVVTVYEMNTNGTGSNCLKPTQMRDIGQVYDNMQQKKLEKIKRISSKISSSDFERHKLEQEEAKNMRRSMISFLAIKCITSWSDTRCKTLKDQGCITAMTEACTNSTLQFYKDEYPNTICRDSIFTRYTSANREVAEMNEYYIEPKKIVGWISAIIGMIMIYFFINIPTKVPDIITKIKESFRAHSIELAQVCLIYDVEEFMSLKKEFQEVLVKQAKQKYLDEQKAATSQQPQDKAPLLDKFEKEKTEIMNKIKGLESKFSEGASSSFVGQAYISFKFSKDRDVATSTFRPRGWKWRIFHLDPKPTPEGPILKIKNEKGEESHMNVTSCGEPGDIIWENLGYSRVGTLIRQSLSLLLTFFIIIIDFIGIYALKVVGMNLVRTSDGKASDEFNIYNFSVDTGISVAIFAVDFLLQSILLSLAKWEKRETLTIEHFKAASKIWKVQFLASSVVPLLVSLNMFNYYGPNGLVTSINSQFITNIVLTPLIDVINSINIMGLIGRKKLYKSIKASQSVAMTQKEANELFKKLNFEMYEKYAMILKTVAMGFFYMPMIPMAAMYLLVFLLIMYFVEKYILMRHSNKLVMYSGVISRNLIGEMEYMMVLYCVGLYVEQNIGRLSKLIAPTLSYYDIIIFLAIFLIRFFEVLKDKAKPSKSAEEEDLKYDDIKKQDFNDYDLANPAMAAVARKNESDMAAMEAIVGITKTMPKDQEFNETDYLIIDENDRSEIEILLGESRRHNPKQQQIETSKVA